MKKVILTLYFWGCVVSAFTQIPTDGLLAYYPFNGNANDISGNTNHGTVTGATLVPDRFGLSNKAYYFDGISNFIDCGTNPLMAPTTTQTISISVWIKPSFIAVDTYGRIICSKVVAYQPNNANFYGAIVYTQPDKFNIRQNNAVVHSIISDEYALEQWYHLVMVFQEGTNKTKLYVNGQLAKEETVSYSSTISTAPFMIGNMPQFGANDPFHFKGIIDDLAVYNRALSPSEVINLYDGSNNYIVANYPFNGTLNDSSPSGVNPTNAINITYGTDRSGAIGKTLYLNNPTDAAATSYLEFSPANFQFDRAFSFSVWVNYEGGYVNPRIFEIGEDGSGFNLGVDANKKFYFYHKGSGLINPTNTVTNRWYHIAGTYDGLNTLKLYIDGQLVQTSTSVSGVATYNTNFFIGRKPTAVFDGFKGRIDELTFYRKELLASEVASLYSYTPSTANYVEFGLNNTHDPNAIFEATSPNKGVLLPRIDFNDRPTTSLVSGLLIYVIANGPQGNNCFYYWNGTSWVKL